MSAELVTTQPSQVYSRALSAHQRAEALRDATRRQHLAATLGDACTQAERRFGEPPSDTYGRYHSHYNADTRTISEWLEPVVCYAPDIVLSYNENGRTRERVAEAPFKLLRPCPHCGFLYATDGRIANLTDLGHELAGGRQPDHRCPRGGEESVGIIRVPVTPATDSPSLTEVAALITIRGRWDDADESRVRQWMTSDSFANVLADAYTVHIADVLHVEEVLQ
jgi:hypothetical protein